jgi:hypothetical protein
MLVAGKGTAPGGSWDGGGLGWEKRWKAVVNAGGHTDKVATPEDISIMTRGYGRLRK